ncbi:hypothetical protein K440DRAFT_208150 [Wilcoxina mikolae CBS 423.85]|nr:hypothetical protein K440DRAFT_208150 [Wilcoxina mikolae CBS 423.85]
MFTTANIQVGHLQAGTSREKKHDKMLQYIVVGVFRKDSNAPREVVVKLERNTSLSSALWRGMFRVRGWRYFQSLKVVRGFGIYECDPNNGSHRRIPLDTRKQQIVNQIYYEYMMAVNRDAWIEWIWDTITTRNLSIELILGWSVARISVVVSFPVILSFVIGMWYMKATGDVQTAWTIASYVVTAVEGLLFICRVAGWDQADDESSDHCASRRCHRDWGGLAGWVRDEDHV